MVTCSPKQEDAISKVMDWYKNSSEQTFTIAGYAGTGKTTIAKIISDNVTADTPGEPYFPQFVTFTGKASSVLRAKGCLNCTTIHSLLYSSADKCKLRLESLRADELKLKVKVENGTINPLDYNYESEKLAETIEQEKKNINQPSFFLDKNSELKGEKLIIVDEYSMLDSRIVSDMTNVCKGKILFLGDPGQLPPVGKKQYDFKPDVFLDEIHRQAMDSPILRAATFVRENGYIDMQNSGDFKCVSKNDMAYEQYNAADQIITGKNDNAKMFNRRFRQKLGYESILPYAGEKVMCFKNNHDLQLLNGVVYEVTEDSTPDPDWPETALLSITDGVQIDGVAYANLPVWSKRFEYRRINPEPEMWTGLEQFDYCYGITAHKSQGSEWDEVVVYDDGIFYNNKSDRKRWLYTSITRASKKCTVVRA